MTRHAGAPHAGNGVRADQSRAITAAAVGQRCIHAGQRATVSDAVGRADFGRVAFRTVRIDFQEVAHEQLGRGPRRTERGADKATLHPGFVRDSCDHGRHPPCIVRRQPDPEFEPQRARDLFLEKSAEALSSRAMHQLADGPCHGDGVIADARTWRPERRLCSHAFDHRCIVVKAAARDRFAHVRHTDAVIEGHRYSRIFLAANAELRPVVSDAGVEIERATIGQEVRAQCHCALGRGEHRAHGVAFPGVPGAGFAPAP